MEGDYFLAKVFAPVSSDTKLYLELPDEGSYENGYEKFTSPKGLIEDNEKNEQPSQTSLIVKIKFVAEGAANAVFSMEVENWIQDSTSSTESLARLIYHHLLRLRKIGGARTPPYIGPAKLYRFIQGEIEPFVPDEFMIDQALVGYSNNFVNKCNSLLKRLEKDKVREPKRHGSYVNDGATRIGLLVEDMRPKDAGNSTMIEFKFKWLKQSPGAPINAKRCRTCAWHTMHEVGATGRYCPLALASGEIQPVSKEILRLLQAQKIATGPFSPEQITNVVGRYFSHQNAGHELIKLLQRLQGQLDPEGILRWIPLERAQLSGETYTEDEAVASALSEHLSPLLKLSRAMTLRDCSIFVQISKDAQSEPLIVAKLGDLDPKGVEKQKLLKWAKDERRLLQEGYYTDTKPTTESTEAKVPEICALWYQT